MLNIRKFAPLITGIGLMLLLVTIAFTGCMKVTGGKFIYILDDAYIHLAFVKNIVMHNVWGVTRYEHSSSVSSPLWTLILTVIFFITGVNEFVPLVLNILFSFILITITFLILRKHSLSNTWITLSLLAVILLTPITLNIFTGMEHLLQAIFAMLFIFYAVTMLTKFQSGSKGLPKHELILFTLAFFLTAVRYEDLILILLISSLFFFQKRFLTAVLITLSGIIPLLIFGLISVYHDGFILPNSVLMKAGLPESIKIFIEKDTAAHLFNYISVNKKLIFLFLISLILFIQQLKAKKKFMSEIPLLLFIIAFLILFQKIFSLSFFRYDTYLVIISIVINSIALYSYLTERFKTNIDFTFIRKNKIVLICFFTFIIFLAYKSLDTNYVIIASKNIYEQQYQMSRFISKYYSGDKIALNDIGSVDFFADIHCIDLIGIGNNEVTRSKLNSEFDITDLKKLPAANNLKAAFLYKSWFKMLPPEWEKAGTWKIPDNFICGDDEVSIYATQPGGKDELIKNLRAFADELPVSVIQALEQSGK
ncbi:MAG: hypothetical protein ABI462_02495 [Ignavibacteria bacterium]